MKAYNRNTKRYEEVIDVRDKSCITRDSKNKSIKQVSRESLLLIYDNKRYKRPR